MLISLIRTLVLYSFLILAVRLMGKRQIGEMEPAEFVVAMLLADLASVPMQNNGISLFSGLVPILAVLALELILAAVCMKAVRLRRLFCGKPVILIENGRILQENLYRTRLNPDELAGQLREQGVMDLNTVQYAILETNGKISVFPYGKYRPANAAEANIRAKDEQLPYTIISDGRCLKENLRLSGRNETWLDAQLRKRGCRAKEVYLLTVDSAGTVYFCAKEGKAR